MNKISRKSFLHGAAGALGVTALGMMAGCSSSSSTAASSTAASSEAAATSAAPAEYTYADTIVWDAQYDVVVLGMGAAGMVSAKTAADNGAKVLIAEKMNESLAGGNSKVCGQLFAYANGDQEAAKTYYTALAGGRELPEGILDAITDGVANMADILADEFGFNKEEYVDWTGVDVGGTNLGAMSPEYPEMPGSEKMALWTTHAGVSDSYLFNGLKQNVLDRADSIDVWYESPAVSLIQEPETKTIIGVTVERGGSKMNVRALNGVVIATGGFECNPEMVQHYLNIINYGARGGQYNTGDGILMAQAVGADLWHMSCYEGLFGLGGVIWPVELGTNCAQPATLTHNALNTGAAILVGTDGARFLNESELVRHGHLYENGIWENPKYPEKIWYIFDETQKALIDAEELIPADKQEYITEYASIEDMAAGTGCKPETLAQTIADFNSFAKNGRDYAQGREAEYMRAFDGKKYYAMYVMNGILNTQGGPRRDEEARVIDVNGDPIPHLYSAGECGGITVCMYQGGTNIAECITFGRIAGKNAAAAKDELPLYTAPEAVESNPAEPGEITDIGAATTEYEAGENQYVGSAAGMNGDVVVRITMDGDTISAVEVLEQAETEGIGSLAIEQLPDQFIGLSAADAVEAVDGVSGATITSNALKNAVIDALSQVQ